MDNKKYEALIHIAETGSITQTATIMGYTQSGITQMINSMEKELGVRLLTRTNKGAQLTNYGKKLLPFMREENLWEKRIRQECDRMTGKETGTVTVGCLSSISTSWMPTILEAFAARYPNIHIHMLENEAPELELMLMSGQIDAALMEIGENNAYNSEILVRDEIFVIVPEKHPLAGRTGIPISELKNYPFISYATGASFRSDHGGPEQTLGGRIELNSMYTCKNDFTAIEMVRHNLGITIAGDLMVGTQHEGVARISLDPPMFRTLGIATRGGSDMLPATKRFLKCVTDVIGQAK